MKNLKSGSIEQFEKFSQFESLKEFNHHVEQWMLEYKDEFSKGELMGLKRLVRFAVKIPGICNAKIGTVLAAVHKEYNNNGISRSTFKRMIIKAKNLGIFSVYETERKNGSQSSNLYIFNRFPSYEPPKHEIMDQPKETNNLLKTEKEQKNNKRKEQPSASEIKLDHNFVSSRVPKPFVYLVKYFFTDAKTIEEYWHMTKIAAYGFDLVHATELMLDVAIDSFRQLIRKLKLIGTVNNPIAYYYGILKNKFFQHYEQAIEVETDVDEEENDYTSLLYSAISRVL
ncbi:hypothetical protein [Neobacillus mesonae]|uniref:Helix-turn-helix domain-containing protein n=1 Tax=Neobacillus mesonae TaxID=1193713 RepID=A0A3T0HU09_9BACI|nr:hypothetical protein [Neobacillus mesonae]AZU60576.1 hypothetical protein CHR53_04445 [Neobacillus mesonae]